MTPNEFKSWFEGFTEAFSGMPTKAQWARIKERVGEIDGRAITEKVFVDRWYPYIYPRYAGTPTYPYTVWMSSQNTMQAAQNTMQSAQDFVPYNSCLAMNAVGRAEAASLKAA